MPCFRGLKAVEYSESMSWKKWSLCSPYFIDQIPFHLLFRKQSTPAEGERLVLQQGLLRSRSCSLLLPLRRSLNLRSSALFI
jgi:hypothetical protein